MLTETDIAAMPPNERFMRVKLYASGLVPADVDATPVLDYNGNPAGFKLPYYLPTGAQHPHMHRVRLENPAPGQGKYTQPSTESLVAAGHPASTGTHPYLNPYILGTVPWATLGATAKKRLLIVEGELKAASAGKLMKVAAIGIPGCDGGVSRVNGIAHVHPVIKALIQPGDSVEVVFDGDVLTNPGVNRAAGTLKRALARLGVRPVFRLLPRLANGAVGLDDWLMSIPAGDRLSAFTALPTTDGAEFDECWVSLADFFGLVTGKTGIALPLIGNLQTLLEKHERYSQRYYFDVMRGNLYRNDPGGPRPFTDAFGVDEVVWLQRRTGMVVSKSVALDALRWMVEQPRWQRNLMLESVGAWDGTPRLETMFVNGWGTPRDDYTLAVGRNWLVSAIARAANPGCKVDTMLVLCGPQGIYKSRSLEVMAGDYYVATHARAGDKDFILALHRGWIIDMAELSSMNHTDATMVKGIAATATDHIRPPYGTTVNEMKRHSILVGTTNETHFLRDPTGNRRFWPIDCGVIDMAWIAANRDQLLAEAKVKYEAGTDWWTMPMTATLAAQAARTEIGVWDEPLTRIIGNHHNFRIITVKGINYRYITSEELMDALGLEVRLRKSHMYRDLAAAMRRIGRGWENYFFAGTITFPGGGNVDTSRGYRLQISGNPLATVIDLPTSNRSTQPF